jgi:gliding motility-associated-like protein
VYVPNSFTPNKDGKNDEFRIRAADGNRLIAFHVYNRWGQVVYTGSSFGKGWDGTFRSVPQPEGTYVYFLQMKSSGGRLITKKGTVTLFR